MANGSSGWGEKASGMFSGLRDRLSGNRDNRDDGYDDYADYDDYGYDDGYDDNGRYSDGNSYSDNGGYDDYGDYGYDDNAADDYESSAVGPVTTRAAGTSGRYNSSRSYSSDRYGSGSYASSSYRSGSGYSSTKPRLVSMDEARSSVTARSGEASSYRPSASGSYRSTQSGSYDPHYSSASTGAQASTASSASTTPVYQIPLTKAAGARNLEVLRPKEYGDVADMAATLRKGDAVVLTLKLAPSAISTRVLDFAFGVASALDANVECIGDKVFFVVRGEGISEGEREKLRLQGIVQ
jgi:FtsZ-interacting cell division protein YlmF